MQRQEVERFKLRTRVLHWAIVVSFLTCAITGLFLYVPQFGIVAQDSYTRVIHRIAVVVFILSPILYFLVAPKNALRWLKEVFTWGSSDISWLEAAPDYYFGGDERKMPPQPHMNTGQKMYALVVVLGSIGFLVTGIIMWFFKGTVSQGAFQWSVFAHDVCFIGVGSMLLLHFYLSVVHPRMTESMRSMISGKVSVEYAKSHHGKWYEEVLKGKEGKKERPSAQVQEQG